MNCFKESVDRLLKKTASRIFRETPQAGVSFVTQLSYENANEAHCGHPAIQSKDRLIWIYLSLKKLDPHTISLAIVAACRGYSTGNASSTKVKYKSSYERLSKN